MKATLNDLRDANALATRYWLAHQDFEGRAELCRREAKRLRGAARKSIKGGTAFGVASWRAAADMLDLQAEIADAEIERCSADLRARREAAQGGA